MKKIFSLLSLIGVFLLLSCGGKESGVELERSDVLKYSIIRYATFDGHEYVVYSKGKFGSMCHSPKCHCLKKDSLNNN